MEQITGAALSIFLYYMKTYNFIKGEVLNLLVPLTDRYDLFDILLIWSVIVIIFTTLYTRLQRARKFGLKRVLGHWFTKQVRSIGFIENRIEKELNQIKNSIEADISKNRDPVKTVEIPQTGVSDEAIRRKALQWQKNDYKHYGDKKITGCLYYNEAEKLTTLVKDIAKDYFYINPLHFDLFPNAAQMEGEVIAMVKNLYNGDDEAVGVLTSGGTESIMTAMLAYREWGKDRGISDPEIVAPISAHVAVEKAAFYYGMRVTYVPVSLETGTVDPADIKAAISKDTVCVFGSYPNYPYGTVDPIEELAEIARKRGIGFHSDCCLGGFVAPFAHKFGAEKGAFDFRVKGVTSISVDPHKYGLAPKGVSVCLFRNRKLRLGSIFSSATWPGGVYATPTHAGSRGLGPVAGAWVALLNTGYNGYMDKAGKLIEATRRCVKKLGEIKEIQIVGNPELAVVSFVMRDKRLNCYQLVEKMNHKGWHLASLQKPPGLHLAITNYNVNLVEDFISAIKTAVAEMVANPPTKKGDLAQLYGSAAVLPENIVRDGVKLIIEATLKP